jgi:hypothetical protein
MAEYVGMDVSLSGGRAGSAEDDPTRTFEMLRSLCGRNSAKVVFWQSLREEEPWPRRLCQ